MMMLSNLPDSVLYFPLVLHGHALSYLVAMQAAECNWFCSMLKLDIHVIGAPYNTTLNENDQQRHILQNRIAKGRIVVGIL